MQLTGKVDRLLDRRRLGAVRIVHLGPVLPVEPEHRGHLVDAHPEEMHSPL